MTQWDPNIRNCGWCNKQIVLNKGNFFVEKASKRKKRFHKEHLREFLLRKVYSILLNQGKTQQEIQQLEIIGEIENTVNELKKEYEYVLPSPNGAVPVSTYAFSKKKKEGYIVLEGTKSSPSTNKIDIDGLGSIEGHLELVIFYIQFRNFDKANERIEEAIKKYPLVDKPLFFKALILDMQDEIEEALNCYDCVIKINPKNTDAWINKGNMEAKGGNWGKARFCYEKAHEINPDDSISSYNIDIALSNLKNQKDAKSTNDLISINPFDYKALFKTGKIIGNEYHKWDEACYYFEKASEINSDNAEIWYFKGISYDISNKFDIAIECFNRAIEINPSNAQFWNNKANSLFNKGTALFNLGRYKDALVAFEEAIEINPNEFLFSSKGTALLNLGRYEEALVAYSKAIEFNPKEADALNYKGFSLLKINKPKEAFECFNRAIEINPSNAQFWNNKAICLENIGKYAEALQCYDEALKREPDNNNIKAYRNECFQQLQQKKDEIHRKLQQEEYERKLRIERHRRLQQERQRQLQQEEYIRQLYDQQERIIEFIQDCQPLEHCCNNHEWFYNYSTHYSTCRICGRTKVGMP